MMSVVTVDPEQPEDQFHAEQIRQAHDEARRQVEHFRKAAREPAHQREWLRQNSVIYGGLIAIGLILIQPFFTTTLDRAAKICMVAFSVAIPLLVALVMVNHQESFRRRVADSVAVRVTRPVALLLAFVGAVAGFWHVAWFAGVAFLISGFVATLVHSAGYVRVERIDRDAGQ